VIRFIQKLSSKDSIQLKVLVIKNTYVSLRNNTNNITLFVIAVRTHTHTHTHFFEMLFDTDFTLHCNV